MPAKSQAQRGMIFARRDQYKSKAKTPKKWQWIWDEDFENKGKLPKKIKNETVQNIVFNEGIERARFVNEIYDGPYVSDHTGAKPKSEPVDDERWTLKSGDKVEFDLRGMGADWIDEDPEQGYIAKQHNGDIATVTNQATFTEIGDRDFEYYDIEFDNGDELYAVSGYHLFDI